MGIGRREFLKLCGGTLAATSSAIDIFDDLYVNWKLGIAFRKPHGWTFADVKTMGEIVAGQIFQLDDVLESQLVDSAELPILTISKVRLAAHADRFTPGITVYLDFVDDLPDAVMTGNPAYENASADIESCKLMLNDFCVTSPPKPTSISKCDAVEYYAAFVFEHENIDPTPVRMRTLTIYQIPAIYTLRMYDAPCFEPAMIVDYTTFVESVNLV